jgi:hypothetical protein
VKRSTVSSINSELGPRLSAPAPSADRGDPSTIAMQRPRLWRAADLRRSLARFQPIPQEYQHGAWYSHAGRDIFLAKRTFLDAEIPDGQEAN